MKEVAYNHKISESMNSGFVKILQDKLMNEERPFEMRMRRIVFGKWKYTPTARTTNISGTC